MTNESIITILSLVFGTIVAIILYLRAKHDTAIDKIERRKADKAIILTRDPAYNAVFNEANKIETITVDMSANLHGSSKLSANLSVHEKGKDDTPKLTNSLC